MMNRTKDSISPLVQFNRHKDAGYCPYRIRDIQLQFCQTKTGGGYCAEHLLDKAKGTGKMCDIAGCGKQAIISTMLGHPKKESAKCDLHAGQFN